MMLAVQFDRQFTPSGYVAYRNQFLRDAGSPTDPVEIAMLEQIALCHLRSANLHAKATTAAPIEATEAYSGMSVRVGTELRKTAATLEAYRASKAARKAK